MPPNSSLHRKLHLLRQGGGALGERQGTGRPAACSWGSRAPGVAGGTPRARRVTHLRTGGGGDGRALGGLGGGGAARYVGSDRKAVTASRRQMEARMCDAASASWFWWSAEPRRLLLCVIF